jgi:hypothetical protein
LRVRHGLSGPLKLSEPLDDALGVPDHKSPQLTCSGRHSSRSNIAAATVIYKTQKCK